MKTALELNARAAALVDALHDSETDPDDACSQAVEGLTVTEACVVFGTVSSLAGAGFGRMTDEACGCGRKHPPQLRFAGIVEGRAVQGADLPPASRDAGRFVMTAGNHDLDTASIVWHQVPTEHRPEFLTTVTAILAAMIRTLCVNGVHL